MSEEQNLRPVYDDDQPGEEAYKRGAAYKQTRARKADYEDKLGSEKRQRTNDNGSTDKKETRSANSDESVALAVDSNGNPIPTEPRLPKRKVAVMIGYCGTGYHGMQYNPPNDTIEKELFEAFVRAGAISKANSTDLKKNGFQRAARTDKGVHAGGNVISLKLIIEDPDIKEKINKELPEQIRVWDISRVNKAFDCRKMCSSRWYEYLLPTYSLIGPKPSSYLYKEIAASKEEIPGVIEDDVESAEFWDLFHKEVDSKFTKEELEEISSFVMPKENFDENNPTYQKCKAYKKLETKHKRAYRISKERLERFRSALKQYEGTYNFHNFTLGKDFNDPSAKRFMKELTVSEPFVIGEEKTEWVSIKIHGQSFMLHQIRKMISMATLITRCFCPLERISQAYGAEKINIPKAPALGLLLEAPVYDGYNTRLQEFGYTPIDFSKFQSEMDAFKMKHIYDKIYQEEVNENVFNAFFSYIDTFNPSANQNQQEPLEAEIDEKKDLEDSKETENDTTDTINAAANKGKKPQRPIFDFLTARGITQAP
ncbi:tRNA pseudouridine synthase 1 [Kluyveromyces marxianus]|uniref:tRNA pseudouridine synthase 1 n=2 Tax=Kluyveromyces marxianus TaxID=4911 RepID=W0TCN4_KLUMD|nr:tRNA pseudouridine synthase 1 [Kluyveromyces marxianus DMKU3-1042]QGN16301.1 tRNA pseudouridine synthase 1 [Kluyveromyces marxianus]BAO40571.1 tRNA pseudouridine synthase 1 [Kluyveromyces marxianus DMKU3-1042]BAP72052.1 tRNA pseudouridine synthase 1 [Kluyveromyces marxianus]